jgi:HlyD family secretion protein
MVAHAQSQLTLNEISIKTAQREFDRLSQLAPSHAIAQQQLEQASDTIATARAQYTAQLTAIQTARAQLAQADYNEELTTIRAPMDGKINRRYANPGSGASTLNETSMFDLEPAIPHVVRAEITESAVPDVSVGQAAEISFEADPSKVATGRVLRIAATFGARKNKSDVGNEASDERVVEAIVLRGILTLRACRNIGPRYDDSCLTTSRQISIQEIHSRNFTGFLTWVIFRERVGASGGASMRSVNFYHW